MAESASGNSVANGQPIHQYIKLLSEQQNQQSDSNSNLSYIRTIILKSLSDPAVYTGFTELKHALQSSLFNIEGTTAGQSLLSTLDLFSHGSYLDYKSATANDDGTFVKLNEAQETKLKLLTIVTAVQQTLVTMGKGDVTNGTSKAACTTKRTNRRNRRHQKVECETNNVKSSNHKCAVVQYSTLQSAIGTKEGEEKEENRMLENLLIKCIYTNLLPDGTKLDQKNACLVVKNSPPISLSSQESSSMTPDSTGSNNTVTVSSLCRDIDVETDIPDMISKLETMYNRGEKVKFHLMESLNGLNKGMNDDAEKWKKVEESIQLAKEKVNEKKQNVAEAGGAGGAMAMMMLNEIGRRIPSKSGNLKRSRGGKA